MKNMIHTHLRLHVEDIKKIYYQLKGERVIV